ncbi:MAG: class I SAM-dependent methyltransferase [Phycisphaerales bacterium]|nr:MAG: class I SAM-dependent methyltransferase [Phycisphaerales bacterium]
MEQPTRIEKAPGHWVLARLGKKVLRPGGVELTGRMLDRLDIGPDDDVVEFAPGLGATARLTLQRRPRSYVAIERDEAAAESVRRCLNGTSQRCVVGAAQATGLPDACASVVYGEAMLTMQTPGVKSHVVAEAARLLRDGGRYGIHEIVLAPETIDPDLAERVRRELTDAIHHAVLPLTEAGWRELLESCGLRVAHTMQAPMHLLEPRRLIRDEGVRGAARFAWNALRDGAARRRVLAMRRVFRRYQAHLEAVAIIASKPRQSA